MHSNISLPFSVQQRIMNREPIPEGALGRAYERLGICKYLNE